MDLRDIVKLQNEFDAQHQIHFKWNESISDENLQMLGYLVLSLSGEVGELANITKKILRGDQLFKNNKAKLSEELADVFIYVLKLSYQMDVDLEKSFLEKLEINKSRFESFKRK